MDAPHHPRFLAPRLLEAVADSPVVLIHGPRQCGKTTLAQTVLEPRGYHYYTFDDDTLRASALADPRGFVDELPPRAILDEVQRVPELFAALKVAVDARRAPGRFVVTGSSNVLLLPALADSLAGRMAILRLHPLAQAEVERRAPRFVHQLLAGKPNVPRGTRLAGDLVQRVLAGGFPAALARPRARRRSVWYRDYVDTLVQRDVRSLARIASLDAIPRLLALIAAQTAQLVNVSELAGPFSLSRPTIREYLTLLERIFVVDEIPAWHSNRTSRLLKSAKLHVGDTGVACALLGLDAEDLSADRALFGRLLETFVTQELRRIASFSDEDVHFFHYRDRDGGEVDVVLERGTKDVVGVEVKASATVAGSDFRGLRRLRDASGSRFRCGVVLYDGESQLAFGDGLFAVPLRALWTA